jgi:hypothetical protein
MEKLKKNKLNILLIFAFFGILTFSIVALSGNIVIAGKVLNDYEIISQFNENNNSRTQFQPYKGKYIISYSNEGIKLMDYDGNTFWTQAYTMNAPKLLIKEDYIAVGDIKGRNIYLFNQQGFINKMYSNYPIINFELNESGFIGYIEEFQNKHFIYLYDRNGQYANGETSFERDGYPLDIALSKDGTKLITSYFYTDGQRSETRMAFYNYSRLGQNYVQNLAGFIKKEEAIVPAISFFDNDTIGAFGDTGVYIYKMEQTPREHKDILLDKEIKSIIIEEDFMGLVHKKEDNQYYELDLYTHLGKKTQETSVDIMYKYIEHSKDEIIFFNEWESKIYSSKGKLKWEHTFDFAIQQIIPLGNNQYLVVSANEAKIIKLK